MRDCHVRRRWTREHRLHLARAPTRSSRRAEETHTHVFFGATSADRRYHINDIGHLTDVERPTLANGPDRRPILYELPRQCLRRFVLTTDRCGTRVAPA